MTTENLAALNRISDMLSEVYQMAFELGLNYSDVVDLAVDHMVDRKVDDATDAMILESMDTDLKREISKATHPSNGGHAFWPEHPPYIEPAISGDDCVALSKGKRPSAKPESNVIYGAFGNSRKPDKDSFGPNESEWEFDDEW